MCPSLIFKWVRKYTRSICSRRRRADGDHLFGLAGPGPADTPGTLEFGICGFRDVGKVNCSTRYMRSSDHAKTRRPFGVGIGRPSCFAVSIHSWIIVSALANASCMGFWRVGRKRSGCGVKCTSVGPELNEVKVHFHLLLAKWCLHPQFLTWLHRPRAETILVYL